MKVTTDTVKVMLEMQGLNVPESELDNITTRLATWLEAMQELELEMGHLLDHEDPIPPVFPHDDY
jgi:hypothetical protein